MQAAQRRPRTRGALRGVLGATDGAFVGPLVQHVSAVPAHVLEYDVGKSCRAARVASGDELFEQVAVLGGGSGGGFPAASAVAIVMLILLLIPILIFNRVQQREMEGRLT